MDLKDFIELNKEFLGYTYNNKVKENLLVENPCDHYFINHCMGVQTTVLNMAKDFKPLWLRNDNIPIEFLKSYVPTAEYTDLPEIKPLERFYIDTITNINYLKLLLTKNIINFHFDKVKYGDIIYDTYLAENQVGTIKNIDSKIKKLIKRVITKHRQIKKLVKREKINAVLTSHRIGINCGVIVRAAVRFGCLGYTNFGLHRNALHLSKNSQDLSVYEITPTKNEIDKIMDFDDELFNKRYEEIKNFHQFGNANMDAQYAFSDSNTFYEDKEPFCEKYNLDSNKKNIFVMLHAFTDHPHSHFKKMIFKDYANWFLKTLDYAKKDKNVNWIFKQHPSDKYYPTKDIIFQDLFKNLPDNIIFLSTEDKVDTRSLGNIADAIITCLGSAGFEVPAFFGIPSITAGDNHYQGFDFSKSPKTKREYYKILKNLKNITKLSEIEQKKARAVYMFLYYYSMVDYTIFPVLSHEDHHNPNFNEIFFDKVKNLYENSEEIIKEQINKYSSMISKDNFVVLRTEIK